MKGNVEENRGIAQGVEGAACTLVLVLLLLLAESSRM